ncbi:AAA family ATPase [Pseudomonas sp. NPDC007930]|uniref:trifunctional serine/threonine-protein kinase/ATP-binding protein/sensor histidine kinase n=1 Tax=Pseudomonas sp. NPDC007930 TaxID=3364417 RepID=UPI0036E44DD8
MSAVAASPASFDAAWLASLAWQPLDEVDRLQRWQLTEPGGRQWLGVRASDAASAWEHARLDREYSLGPCLAADWALLPVARLNTDAGLLVVFDGAGCQPLSALIHGTLALERFAELALGCCEALAKAHAQGIVHRDLRPAHWLLGADGRVRLAGFAYAHVAGQGHTAPLRLARGSLAYLAPEHAGAPSPAADLYALGVCFYQWLAGQLPLQAASPEQWLHQHLAVAPAPLLQWRPDLPQALAAVVEQLLAKQPAQRPASAGQLLTALWPHRAGCAAPREHTPSTPPLWVGRQPQLATLQAAGAQWQGGQGGAVLIEGVAGIGKTRLVRHWYQGLGSGPWLLASAKCEQGGHAKPYASLASALGALFNQLASANAPQPWRAPLREALASSGGTLTHLLPQLQALCGPLPPGRPAEGEARRQQLGALKRLLAALARPAHPLLMFLDDAQWLDEETLGLLLELPEAAFGHLLLVLTYRPSALDDGEPLPRLRQHLARLGARCRHLALPPLTPAEINELLAASLPSTPDTASLASRLHRQADGNPLYVCQVIDVLRESATPLPAVPAFADLPALMHTRLAQLPAEALAPLRALALLADPLPLAALAEACELPEAKLLADLRPAFKAGLLSERQAGLTLAHDAVAEALRAPLSAAEAATLHQRLATNLLRHLPAQAEPAAVFRAASQAARATPPRAAEQRLAWVALLARASRLAHRSVAPATALDYAKHAQRLNQGLGYTALERELALLEARCRVLAADYHGAEQGLRALLASAPAGTANLELYRLRGEIHTLQGDYPGALGVAREGLATLGLVLAEAPSKAEAEQRWQGLCERLGNTPLQRLLALPRARASQALERQALLAVSLIPGSFIAPHWLLYAASELLTQALDDGLSAASVHGLGWLGVAMAEHLGLYAEGREWAECAQQLAERPEYSASAVSVLLALEQVSPWTRPLPRVLGLAEQALQASLAQGAPSFACFANLHVVADQLVMGAPIERMLHQIDTGLAMAGHLEFNDAQAVLFCQARYIRRLAGPIQACVAIPEREALAAQVQASQMGPLKFWWELFEGLFLFLEGQFAAAAERLDAAWGLTWAAPCHIHQIDLALFSVLNRAAMPGPAPAASAFEPGLGRLRQWAALNPAHFADRLALAEAEVLRAQGEPLAALKRFEEAIGHAARCGAVHIQGLAHLLEGRCLAELGLAVGAHTHQRLARDAWRRWGAPVLAEHLEAEHPHLREQPAAATALAQPPERDMLAMLTACQALSREISPQALVNTLLRHAITQAGATDAALVVLSGATPWVQASAHAHGEGIEVQQPAASAAVPLGMVGEAAQRGTPWVLDAHEAFWRYAQCPYLAQLGQGSLACVPLLDQQAVYAVLFLCNRHLPAVFGPAVLDRLALLCNQAAISLANARTYASLLQENQRRRSSEASLRRTQALLAIGQSVSRLGAFNWHYAVEPSFWSERLLGELGLPCEWLSAALDDPLALVHLDDRARVGAALAEACQQPRGLRLELRTLPLADGPRYLELAAEPEGAEAFVGVVLDISERRRTEHALQGAQAELERNAQATLLGELAASITHEVNQPLASILSNAGASLRWLERPAPDVAEAVEGLRDILAEGQRAAAIINGLRTLARQAPAQLQAVNLAGVTEHVLSLLRGELDEHQVQLTLAVPPQAQVRADALQLQQVLRNLASNALQALKAMPPPLRRLHLQAVALPGQWLVTVEDSGPGIAAADQARVFQAFYSTRPGGMGMGLAICASILAAHGGVLQHTEGRAGQTVFFFTLGQA